MVDHERAYLYLLVAKIFISVILLIGLFSCLCLRVGDRDTWLLLLGFVCSSLLTSDTKYKNKYNIKLPSLDNIDGPTCECNSTERECDVTAV